MEVVLRPVNDDFLKQVVFPAFEQGVVDAVPAVEFLLQQLNDGPSRLALEMMLDKGLEGSFYGLEDEHWSEVCYRLVFHEWAREGEGWGLSQMHEGYAGNLEETLHFALMLEDAAYPYADAARAQAHRERFVERPDLRLGLSSLVCCAWDTMPRFPPDQVLTASGQGVYDVRARNVRADWSWRPMFAINSWAARLPNLLSGLLQREGQRLKPVVAPERHELLEHWLGHAEQPPILAVSFSGAGPGSSTWIREIGSLAKMIRACAAMEQGLTAVISRRRSHLDER